MYLEPDWLRLQSFSFVEKALGVLVDKLTISQKCVGAAKAASRILGCIRQSINAKLGEVMFPLC